MITADDLRCTPTAETSADAHEVFSLVYRMRVDLATKVLERMAPRAVRDIILAADILKSTALKVYGAPTVSALLAPDEATT